MRIGIDARELTGRPTGVGRYLRGLIEAWAASEYARRHEFVLYANGPLAIALDSRRFPTHLVDGRGGTWWEQVQLPRVVAHDHLDVFFAPAYTAPLLPKIPTVVAVHDLSFVAHPEWFTMREGARKRWLCKRSARRATRVVTISEFSRRELVERLGVPESRVCVIPPGVIAPAAIGAIGRAASVLFVGSIFNRRHLPDLIRAFAPIARADSGVSLDLVGDDRSFPALNLPRLIEAEGLSGRARWHRYVDEHSLAVLYGSARAFAFLSEYEGLGLTPLEALAAGIPAVLLDTPVARESCADAALYVRAGDISGTTEAIRRVLFDDGVRRRLLAAAPSALAKYQWPHAARETLAVLETGV
jgi:glycosyltransferase involved in cell wall biosynthesis